MPGKGGREAGAQNVSQQGTLVYSCKANETILISLPDPPGGPFPGRVSKNMAGLEGGASPCAGKESTMSEKRKPQRVQIADHSDSNGPYAAPACSVTGMARGSFHNMGQLWALRGRLDEGAALHWEGEHGDEIIFLRSGRAVVNGAELTADSVAVVESGVPAEMKILEASEVIHFGTVANRVPVDGPMGPPEPGNHGIHVIPRGDTTGTIFVSDGVSYNTQYYVDGTCPTCRAAMLRIESDGPVDVAPHTHSTDEIIHLLSGEIHLGARVVSAGMSLAVPADMRYAFKSRGPIEFINYRPDVSYYADDVYQQPVRETIADLKAHMG